MYSADDLFKRQDQQLQFTCKDCSFECTYNCAQKAKAKASDSYIARLTGKPDQPRFTIIESGSHDRQESMVLQH